MTTGASPSAPKRGRPKQGFDTKRITLKDSVFHEWTAKKSILGFGDKTHSDFAEYLLNISDDRLAVKDAEVTGLDHIETEGIHHQSLVYIFFNWKVIVIYKDN